MKIGPMYSVKNYVDLNQCTLRNPTRLGSFDLPQFAML